MTAFYLCICNIITNFKRYNHIVNMQTMVKNFLRLRDLRNKCYISRYCYIFWFVYFLWMFKSHVSQQKHWEIQNILKNSIILFLVNYLQKLKQIGIIESIYTNSNRCVIYYLHDTSIPKHNNIIIWIRISLN